MACPRRTVSYCTQNLPHPGSPAGARSISRGQANCTRSSARELTRVKAGWIPGRCGRATMRRMIRGRLNLPGWHPRMRFAESSVDSTSRQPYTRKMLSRSTLTIAFSALAIFGSSACKSVYSDTFSYRKNSFKAPVAKEPVIKTPDLAPGSGGLPGGVMPGPGGMPAVPGPDPGGIPGIPGGAPAVPGVPGVPAVPAVPGL